MLKIAVMTPRRAYRTDLSDARWALIEPILAAWRAARAEAGLGLSEPAHDLREIVNAILYVNRTGIAWEYPPHDLPPYKTADYDYYAKWEKDGTTETIHDTLHRQVRAAAGRREQPSAAIMDAQPVRTSGNVPESSRSATATAKDTAKITPDKLPVRGYHELISHLATLTRNTVSFNRQRLEKLSTPTPEQPRVFELLGKPIPRRLDAA